MKKFVRHAVALMALTVVCQTGFAQAEDYYWVSGGDKAAAQAGNEKVAGQGQSGCSSCDPTACGPEESCGSCDQACGRLGCDDCPGYGIVGFAGLDSFKGISDGSYQSNFGAVTGINAAMPVLGLGEYGIGWQLGMSYGMYDFDGRSSTVVDRAKIQQQTFITTGFFRKANEDQRLSFGMVYDWMVNDQWGEYGSHPTLGQWRGQVEYAMSGCNAFGLWGTARDLPASQRIRDSQSYLSTRAITQVNLFWHHKFVCSDADSYVWVGVPEQSRLNGDGSLIDWTVGAAVQVPLSERLALYANGAYFHPSASASAGAAIESGYNVGMGVAWYFGGNARSSAINGKCWTPYMSVANNSSFLVDQNPAF